MRSRITMISIAELVLITSLSGIGIYAFINSGIYSRVNEFGEVINLPPSSIPIVLWGLLFLFGIFSITIRGQGSGGLVFFVILLALPSILSHNTLNWPGIFGSEFSLDTRLGFYEMLVLGILIITGYVILNRLHLFKRVRHNLTQRGASNVDIEIVALNSYLVLTLAIAVALVTTTAIVFLSRSLELLVLDYIRGMPWNVVFIGIGCVLLLAVYLYWMGARRRTKDQSSS
ncbi:hypothetical protein ACFLWU_03310 [Chloroflexota bacterium]